MSEIVRKDYLPFYRIPDGKIEEGLHSDVFRLDDTWVVKRIKPFWQKGDWQERLDGIEDLENYPWSSYPLYLDSSPNFITKELILSFLKNIPAFKKFTADQIDYQRKLDEIQHLVLE